MKIHIIYLSPEDDIHSTLDMLSWVKAPRVLLVWPDRGNILSRRLDLVLLKRYSLQRQIGIGLLTFNKDIRDEASEFGIPVFDSLDDLPEDKWDLKDGSVGFQRDKETVSDGISNRRLLEGGKGISEKLKPGQKYAIVIGVILLLFLMMSIILPSAQIYLSPHLIHEKFSYSINLIHFDDGRFESDEIGLHSIKLETSGESTRSTSDYTKVPISPAVGTVVFTSMTQEFIEIPLHTTLRTPGENSIRFRTTRPANLNPEIGSEVEVPVEAITLGGVGNVSSGSISLIDGPLGLYLKVSNREPTSGGRDEIRKMVVQEDLELLEEEVIDKLIIEAERSWADTQIPDQILVRNSLMPTRILDRHFDQHLGDVVDQVALQLSLEYSALTILDEDLEELTMVHFSEEIWSDLTPVPGSFRITPRLQESNDGSLDIMVEVEVDAFHVFDIGMMRKLIRGHQLAKAEALLQDEYPLSSPPGFRLKPKWYPIIPMIDQRIEFTWDWERDK